MTYNTLKIRNYGLPRIKSPKGLSPEKLSIIPYYGGKYWAIDKYKRYIADIASKNNCGGYIELTGGGARTLLNLPKFRIHGDLYEFTSTVYNEYDLGLCNLFATVANPQTTQDLIDSLMQLDYSEDNFIRAKDDRSLSTLSILESAALTYFCAYASRNSDMRTFRKSDDDTIKRYKRQILKLAKCSNRLSNCKIVNGDYKHLLNLYGKDRQILKYIDPPYHPSTRNSAALSQYPCEFGVDDHKEMVDLLCQSSSWILSGYDPYQYGSNDYVPLEKTGALKISMGNIHLSSSAFAGYSNRKEEFIWIKY